MTPNSLRSSIAKRVHNLGLHNDKPELRVLALAMSAKDIVHWFNTWVWTYDPRLIVEYGVATVPMDLFPIQEDLVRWLCDREQCRENGLVEKSRDMGLTWLCAGFLVHHWLFVPGFKGGLGSRKQDLVDKVGDPDCIFEKMRILLRNLPEWMLPVGFDWTKHDNFLKLINPANGATITGEAGDEIGRGGRNSVYVVDEFGFVPHAEKVDEALSQNTDVCIYVSTPNGNGNLFAQKWFSGTMPVFSMHWKQDCRKTAWEVIRESDGEVIDSGPGGSAIPEEIPVGCRLEYPWYEAQKRKLNNPIIVAQELDIDYTASIEGITIPALWVRAAVNLHRRLKLPKSDRTIAGLDVADGGDNDSVLTIRRGCIVGPLFSRKEGGTTDTANWALDHARNERVQALNYDAVGVGAGIGGAFRTKARTTPLRLTASGINVGDPPSDTTRWPDGRTSKERFTNLRAELWWIARTRFEKTYEFVELGIEHPLEELISIPDNPELIQQLSSVLHFTTDTGKTQIESKKDMAKRGVKSPDYADSLLLTFAPVKQPVRMAVGGERTLVTQYRPR